MLTKNEERNLDSCLSHLQWVNELIVVDSGSSDRTLEIAKKYGAKIFINKIDPFNPTIQRNWAIENCVKYSDWILFVDADEIITDKLKEEIIKRISNPEGKIAYRLCFKFMFMGRWIKHVTQFPSWHDRLLKKGNCLFTGGVWEHFDCEEEKIGYICEPYLHYGFNNGIASWIDRHNRYSDVLAKRIYRYRNEKIKWWNIFSKKVGDRERKREFEKLMSRFPFLMPLGIFFYLFIIRKGFLDGIPGFIYTIMLSAFYFFTWLKIIELKYRDKGAHL